MPLTNDTLPAENGSAPLSRDGSISPSPAPGAKELDMKQPAGLPLIQGSAEKFLIRIPQKTDRVKAITAFRRVRATRVTLPGNVMGVNDEHIRVLERENIPFEYVSKAPNGKSTSI